MARAHNHKRAPDRGPKTQKCTTGLSVFNINEGASFLPDCADIFQTQVHLRPLPSPRSATQGCNPKSPHSPRRTATRHSSSNPLLLRIRPPADDKKVTAAIMSFVYCPDPTLIRCRSMCIAIAHDMLLWCVRLDHLTCRIV